MDIINYINFLLKKGLCLKVLYIDKLNKHKFVFLINSDWINKLNIYEKKFKSNIPIDICLDCIFLFKEKTPYAIEYVNLPENFDLQTIDSLNLNDNELHLSNLRDAIIDNKIKLDNYLSIYKLDNSSLFKMDNLDSNQIIINTYPNHKNYINNFKKFKTETINRYFFIKNFEEITQDYNTDYSLLNTFEYLGISINNKDVKDPVFLDSLKKVWVSLIKERKIELYKNLTSEKILNEISETEKDDYLNEIELFKSELDKDDMEILKNFKTVKEIVSYWPSIVHPIPNFVYHEY
jgi:hypothetical protein